MPFYLLAHFQGSNPVFFPQFIVEFQSVFGELVRTLLVFVRGRGSGFCRGGFGLGAFGLRGRWRLVFQARESLERCEF